MEWKRKENEDIRDYKVRLAINKDIYGLTWLEICDILNKETGEKYGESAYRKELTNYIKGINYQIEKSLERNDGVNKNQAILDEINEKLLEIKKEKVKLQTEKIEYNKWIREVSRAELFEEKIVDAIGELNKNNSLNIPKVIVKGDDNNYKEGILTIADVHFGRQGTVYGLNGEVINEYNEEVFERRMWELLYETLNIVEKEKLTKINLFILGDLVDGMLRISQLKSLQYGVIDSTLRISEFLSNWIEKLSNYVEVEVYSSTDNHSEIRLLGTSAGEMPHEQMSRIICVFMQNRLKDNPNVVIHDIKDVNYVDILGVKILSVHGQNDKNLESSIKNYMMLYNQRIDILLSAHYHSGASKVIGSNEYGNIEYIQSPSICSTDEYAIKLKKSAKAGSKLLIIEEGKGKTVTYDIVLK